jgi:hypothetical protein
MGFKRAKADLFSASPDMRWLIENDQWRNVRKFEALPPGTDLMRAFLNALLRYHDAGWTLHEFSAFRAEFFARKNSVHVLVQISSDDPTKPPRKWSDTR